MATPAVPEHSAALALAGEAPPAVPAGTVEHHHLDDLPLQPHGDVSAESPGLLPARLTPVSPAAAPRLPSTWASRAAASPFLSRALRPPCCVAAVV